MIFIRVLMFILCAITGYNIAAFLYEGVNHLLIGTVIGFGAGGIILFIENKLSNIQGKYILGGLLGIVTALLLSHLISSLFLSIIDYKLFTSSTILFIIYFTFGYLGLTIGLKQTEKFSIRSFLTSFKKDVQKDNPKILDTSAIIDGRIADIYEACFIEGDIIVPQFILKELQQIADSSDSLKRNRGRRGLDILQRMQKNMNINIKIVEDDFPKIKEVDSKLVALGQKLGGKVITNDFNLNKVAELQGVEVLNINQLANALKPVVLPGEIMNVFIIKEGKEFGQGIGYLDDGTMVVVDNAKKEIGKQMEVSVTSVLQTTAGRMIFTKLKDDAMNEIHI